jgi:hypothetical protein
MGVLFADTSGATRGRTADDLSTSTHHRAHSIAVSQGCARVQPILPSASNLYLTTMGGESTAKDEVAIMLDSAQSGPA